MPEEYEDLKEVGKEFGIMPELVTEMHANRESEITGFVEFAWSAKFDPDRIFRGRRRRHCPSG